MQRDDECHRGDRPSTWTEAELVRLLQAREERAAVELYERLRPPLRLVARRLKVEPAIREEVIADVLRAICVALGQPGREVPASLAAYAARALGRRVRLVEKRLRASPARLEEALHVRAERAPSTTDDDAATRPGRLGELADALAAALTPDERQLLGWLADHVPQREIARWRGVSYVGMRGRILRLRERARKIAWRWVEGQPPDERTRLTRILRIASGAPRPPAARPVRPPMRPSARSTASSTGVSDDAAS